jgi:hypothetical protein
MTRAPRRRQAGDEVTPAMIGAGIAFAREFLGDLYPPVLPDAPELVSGIWDAMNAAAEAEFGRPLNHRKEPRS